MGVPPPEPRTNFVQNNLKQAQDTVMFTNKKRKQTHDVQFSKHDAKMSSSKKECWIVTPQQPSKALMHTKRGGNPHCTSRTHPRSRRLRFHAWNRFSCSGVSWSTGMSPEMPSTFWCHGQSAVSRGNPSARQKRNINDNRHGGWRLN